MDYYTNSASQLAKKQAELWVVDIWQNNKEIAAYMAKKLNPRYFKQTALKCLVAGGNNNYTA